MKTTITTPIIKAITTTAPIIMSRITTTTTSTITITTTTTTNPYSQGIKAKNKNKKNNNIFYAADQD